MPQPPSVPKSAFPLQVFFTPQAVLEPGAELTTETATEPTAGPTVTSPFKPAVQPANPSPIRHRKHQFQQSWRHTPKNEKYKMIKDPPPKKKAGGTMYLGICGGSTSYQEG